MCVGWVVVVGWLDNQYIFFYKLFPIRASSSPCSPQDVFSRAILFWESTAARWESSLCCLCSCYSIHGQRARLDRYGSILYTRYAAWCSKGAAKESREGLGEHSSQIKVEHGSSFNPDHHVYAYRRCWGRYINTMVSNNKNIIVCAYTNWKDRFVCGTVSVVFRINPTILTWSFYNFFLTGD